MSTTIYNGYRLPADRAVPAIARALDERFGEVFRPLAAETVALVATALIAIGPEGEIPEMLDALTSGQVKPADLRLSRYGTVLVQAAEITDMIQEALRRPHAARLPCLDLTFSAAFMDDPEDPEHLYATICTEQDAYQDAWENVTGAEPFPYWDNADPDDGMTDEEWAARGALWARVLPGYTAPARIGACWEFRPRHDLVWSVPWDGWLTDRLVLDAMAALSGDPERFGAKRDWFAEQLAAPAYPLIPAKPGPGDNPGRTAAPGEVKPDQRGSQRQLPEGDGDD